MSIRASALCVPRSIALQKLQALEQVQNGNSTRKVADAIGMSQSWVVRLRVSPVVLDPHPHLHFFIRDADADP